MVHDTTELLLIPSIRTAFQFVLQAPGIVWTEQGILNAYDRASVVALSAILRDLGEQEP
jgi:hypothetical protein